MPLLLKNNVVPFVWGKQGVGKTETVGQVCKEMGLEFVHLHLATQEPGDLVGLLNKNDDGTVSHLRPEWFPTEGKGVVFLDELNRSHPDVVQAMFSFITSKTIHRHKLPDGWKIVAAGNYASEEFTVTDTSDQAWMSRFCHLHFTPTTEEFVRYAGDKGADRLADFISENPEMLETKTKPVEINVTPDRRAWLNMVQPLEKEVMSDEDRYEVVAGIVGGPAASRYVSFLKSDEKRIKLQEILKDYSKVRERVLKFCKNKDTRFDMLSAPLTELSDRLEKEKNLLDDKKIKNLQEFFFDIPLELAAQTIKKFAALQFKNREKLLNNKEFIDKLYSKKQ